MVGDTAVYEKKSKSYICVRERGNTHISELCCALGDNKHNEEK